MRRPLCGRPLAVRSSRRAGVQRERTRARTSVRLRAGMSCARMRARVAALVAHRARTRVAACARMLTCAPWRARSRANRSNHAVVDLTQPRLPLQ
eukprot:4448708-Pleurochrysis_carterae.AAC.1